jgi:hypothetical protein
MSANGPKLHQWMSAFGGKADMVPDYMRTAAAAITAKQPQNFSLVVSLVEPEHHNEKANQS